MKRVVETDDGGFDSCLDSKITVFGGIYIYTGTLSGVNDDHIELTDAKLVYETGDLTSGEWKDAQKLPSPWRVMRQGIESWGTAKC